MPVRKRLNQCHFTIGNIPEIYMLKRHYRHNQLGTEYFVFKVNKKNYHCSIKSRSSSDFVV